MIFVQEEPLNIIDTNLPDTTNILDDKLYTQVEHNEKIYLKLQTSLSENISFFRLDGVNEIYIKQLDGTDVVLEKTIDLRRDDFSNIWEYFYEDFEFKENFFDEMFSIPNSIVEIEIRGANTPKVGMIVLGRAKYIGRTDYEAKVGIEDFFNLDEDSDSEPIYTPNKYHQLFESRLYINPSNVARVGKILKKRRGKKTVWIANKSDEAKIVLGYLQEFKPVYVANGKAVCNIEIQGVN